MKPVATNRKAFRDYEVHEKYEAGLILEGGEVKSLRSGKASLDGSFCRVEGESVVAYNIHIPEFQQASVFKHEPKRERKLLLHKKEVKRLTGLVLQKGYTIVPLKLYFNNRGWAKVEIALCKGRRQFQKKDKIKEKDVMRDTEREFMRYQKGYR